MAQIRTIKRKQCLFKHFPRRGCMFQQFKPLSTPTNGLKILIIAFIPSGMAYIKTAQHTSHATFLLYFKKTKYLL
jgi:hypothetical protein